MFGGIKDLRPMPIVAGLVVPGVVLAIIAMNLANGRVIWPPQRHSPEFFYSVYTDHWRFWGTIGIKLGVTIAAYAWFWLANHEQTEPRATPVTLVGLGIVTLGFTAVVVGFFV